MLGGGNDETMKRKTLIFVAFVLAVISVPAGCGPSRETLATQKAAMQTATTAMPSPTPTVTPSATPSPTADPRYYYETAGEIPFSYIPPVGWSQDQSANHPVIRWCWKDVTGETTLCRLFFAMDKSDLPFDQYKRSFQKEIVETASVLTEAPFKTETNVEAAKMEVSPIEPDSKTYIVFYFFHQDGYIVIAIYSRAFDADNSQDPIVDASMRTFRFDK
jgi:hypothetical protein